jgi:hypothetical protein
MKKFLLLLILGLSVLPMADNQSTLFNANAQNTRVRLYADCSRGGLLRQNTYKTDLRVVRPFIRNEEYYTLNIHGLRFNEETHKLYDIYIGLPTGTVPSTNSPHYVGILSLFSAPQNSTFSLDITQTINYLKAQGLLNLSTRSIPITFVSTQTDGTRIQFRRITITGDSN